MTYADAEGQHGADVEEPVEQHLRRGHGALGAVALVSTLPHHSGN
jgi:hypothetical protein